MPSNSTRRVPPSSVTFDPAEQRFNTVGPAGVRLIIDDDIKVAAARMVKYGAPLKQAATAYKAGDISQAEYMDAVREWRDNMTADVKGLHLGHAIVAVGGAEQMEQKDFGRVGGLLRVQYGYIENFAIEVADNPDLVLSGGFDNRVSSYAESSRFTYMYISDKAKVGAGLVYVRNVPDESAKSCEGERGCKTQTDLGWIRHDDPRRIRPGLRTCGPGCKCDEEHAEEAE